MEHNIIKLIKNSGYLPQMPQDFGEILQMLLEPYEYSLDEYIDKFLYLPGLESLLIDVLNYNLNLSRKIDTIQEALNYLGAKNAKIIAISYITKLLLPNRKGRTRLFDTDKYWKHCIATSIAAYMIADKTGLSDKDKVFTYGLIHDIGITVLDICLPEYLDKTQELHLQNVHQIVAEKIALGGITHADIGEWLCKEWNLPEELRAVVGLHHTPLLAKEYIKEIEIMYLADSISTNYYERLLGNNQSYIYVEKIMNDLDVDKEFIDIIIQKLPSEVEKLNRILTMHN